MHQQSPQRTVQWHQKLCILDVIHICNNHTKSQDNQLRHHWVKIQILRYLFHSTAPTVTTSSKRVLKHSMPGIYLQTYQALTLTRFLSSSVRASLRTFAQGRSLGHQTGRHSALPHPGLLRPVEYFSISGIKFLSWACWKKLRDK